MTPLLGFFEMAIVGLVKKPEVVDEFEEIKPEKPKQELIEKEETDSELLELTLLDDESTEDEPPPKVEYFEGKDWLTDGHFQRIKKGNVGAQKRRRDVLTKIKTLQAVSLETPVIHSKDKDLGTMLYLHHPSMRGKSKTVGSVIFIFNDSGVAKVPESALNEYNSLLRQPGYKKWPLVERVEVEKLVEKKPKKSKVKKEIKEKVKEEVKKRVAKKKEDSNSESEEVDDEVEEKPKKTVKKSTRKLKKKVKK
jgi:gas vesicle protein